MVFHTHKCTDAKRKKKVLVLHARMQIKRTRSMIHLAVVPKFCVVKTVCQDYYGMLTLHCEPLHQ